MFVVLGNIEGQINIKPFYFYLSYLCLFYFLFKLQLAECVGAGNHFDTFDRLKDTIPNDNIFKAYWELYRSLIKV